MQIKKITSAAIAGTTAMSLFSYLVSEKKDKNFREPDILAKLIERMIAGKDKEEMLPAGWAAHYAAGLAFAAVFAESWEHKKIKPGLAAGLKAGALAGVAGMVIWKATFIMHPDPPGKNLSRYFRHLFFAHLVFGVFAAAGYNLLSEEKNQHR